MVEYSIIPSRHLLKVNNRNTRSRCEICSKLTIKTPEQCQALFSTYFNACFQSNHQTLHIQINLDSKFQLQQAILVFGTNFQTEKNEHHYWILHIRISLSTNFQLKLTILIFWIKFTQKGISSRKKKSEHHHGVLQIWIGVDTKFQLKLIIFSFWTKFTQTSSHRTTSVYFLCSKC